jgi:hypothetical protein
MKDYRFQILLPWWLSDAGMLDQILPVSCVVCPVD